MQNKISLVIPIYNEAGHLESFLSQVDALVLPGEKELIFVNDKSSDNSQEILDQFKFSSTVKIIHHEVNKGKGAALRTGILSATGDFIGIQDADFEYSMDEIPSLLQPLLDDKADVVYGSRFKKSEQVHRTYHYLVNRILTLMSNMACGLYVTDMETCYKFFRADILKNVKLESERFGFEPEITAKIAKLHVRVRELPISYFPRNYLQGKKITWKDGVAALWHILTFSMLRNLEQSFTRDLPKGYIPESSNWL